VVTGLGNNSGLVVNSYSWMPSAAMLAGDGPAPWLFDTGQPCQGTMAWQLALLPGGTQLRLDAGLVPLGYAQEFYAN
jgi:hypothetical protein